MNPPNLLLLRHYGTAGVFFEKAAGAAPFAARVAAAVFSGHMVHSASNEMDRQKLEAHQMNEQFRLLEERAMNPALQNLMHTQAPRFVQAGSDVPVGWDEGMVRLASIARRAGRNMAKIGALGAPMPAPVAKPVVKPAVAPVAKAPVSAPAKPGGMVSGALSAGNSAMNTMFGSSWKGKALALGAVAGGGYLGLKGLNKGLGWASREAPPQSWGSSETQLPMGVNQYGVPQSGTPLMG